MLMSTFNVQLAYPCRWHQLSAIIRLIYVLAVRHPLHLPPYKWYLLHPKMSPSLRSTAPVPVHGARGHWSGSNTWIDNFNNQSVGPTKMATQFKLVTQLRTLLGVSRPLPIGNNIARQEHSERGAGKNIILGD
ncbi:hypothetical protein D9613_011309 [Agrocybe pediades]|uniref:Uncharacterized protein n=1 Tax=Agrocybe pediades TaxID=84607 RepID=A0A8H4QT84_9AGAR|nr:hypothetical protein D9613_011309 [Agrocybe pediades]